MKLYEVARKSVYDYIERNFYVYDNSGNNDRGRIVIEERLHGMKVKFDVRIEDGKVVSVHADSNEKVAKERAKELKAKFAQFK